MNRIQSILLAAAVALPAIATAAEPVANGQKADRQADPRPAAVAPADSVAAGHIFISRAEADSINRAYATVMASYLKPDIANRFPGDSTAVSRFIDGIRHAFDIRKEDSPYYAGVRMAIANFERFDNMVGMGFPLTPDSYVSALAEAMEGNTFGFDRETANHYLESEMQKLYPAPAALSPESQLAFLDKEGAREGVIKCPSGLLFEVISEGEGDSPKADDTVRVTYKGALADGTIFDETEKPIDLPVNGVVKGFSEGLQMMRPGGTYRLFIPPALGYGDRGAGGGVIPPGAALDFTVTLLDIIKK